MEPQIAQALRQIPYGIYLLIAGRREEEITMVVSWVSQISYSPPLLATILRHNRPALRFLHQGCFFSLNLLKREHSFLVSLIKKRLGALNSPELSLQRGIEDIPFLKEALASWICQVHWQLAFGDHIMVIGEIKAAKSSEGAPLTTLDYGKTYLGQD